MTKIAIIGYGEVGTILAQDLAAQGHGIATYDTDPARAASHQTPEAALERADIAFLCVTAGAVLDAARSLASANALAHAPFVVDVNSVSPATKIAAAQLVEAAGGRYVEAAIMASFPPKRLATPMLLGGPHAQSFIAAAPAGMNLTAFAPDIGRASSVKMCRSVMIKGLEALTTECLLAARHYGVEQDVLATLGDTLPHPDWPGLARYVISRALIHGKRRAEEMHEVARTVADAGLDPILSRAIAERQDWAWRRGAEIGSARDAPDLTQLLDALTTTLRKAAE